MSDSKQPDLNEHIAVLNAKLSARESDLVKHVQWLREINNHYTAHTNSLRWRIGDKLVRVIELFLLRPKQPLASDFIRSVLDKFNAHDRRRSVTSWAPPELLIDERGTALSELLNSESGSKSAALNWFRRLHLDQKTRAFADDLLAAEQVHARSLANKTTLPKPLPLVSVVMPAFNRADILMDAVNSVIEQSYPSWELLFCDDGSTDDSIELIESCQDPRVRVLRGRHAGAAAARNRGLEAARGAFIAYLDTDNIWHPNYLAVMVGLLVNMPDRHSVYCSYFDLIVDVQPVHIDAADSRPFSYQRLEHRNFIDLNCFVHRATLYHRFGGFTESLPRRQDWDLILKYAFHFDPLWIDWRLVFYRRHGSWDQLTLRKVDEESVLKTVEKNLAGYYLEGLPQAAEQVRSVSVVYSEKNRKSARRAERYAAALEGRWQIKRVKVPADIDQSSDRLAALVLGMSADLVVIFSAEALALGLLTNAHFGTPCVLDVGVDRIESITRESDRALAQQMPIVTGSFQQDSSQLMALPEIRDQRLFDPDRYDQTLEREKCGISEGRIACIVESSQSSLPDFSDVFVSIELESTLPQAKIVARLCAADALVILGSVADSRWFLEAIAVGLPIVMSVTQMKYFADNELEIEVFESATQPDIADAVKRAKANDSRSARMSRRQYFLRRHSFLAAPAYFGMVADRSAHMSTLPCADLVVETIGRAQH